MTAISMDTECMIAVAGAVDWCSLSSGCKAGLQEYRSLDAIIFNEAFNTGVSAFLHCPLRILTDAFYNKTLSGPAFSLPQLFGVSDEECRLPVVFDTRDWNHRRVARYREAEFSNT